MTIILAWPLKRSAIARLQAIAAGTQPPPAGAELLVSAPPGHPVQVEYVLPAEPDRICVFGTPLSSSRREGTAEQAGFQIEMVRLEIRVRVYDPGEDLDQVDKTLGDMCTAVATAITSVPLAGMGRIFLSGVSQDPTAIAPSPEPSVTGNASLTFTAELVTL
jgi:hypothetical protein